MTREEAIQTAITDAETLARGKNIAARIPCPKCGCTDSISIRTTTEGKAYMGTCATHACIRWYFPELIHRKQRTGIVYPQYRMDL